MPASAASHVSSTLPTGAAAIWSAGSNGGTFAVLTQGEAAAKASDYAQVVSQRVRDLLMHHPTAGAGRYVTVSAGVASLVPPRTLALDGLMKACRAALKRAKKNGKAGIVNAEAPDFN